MHKEPNIDMILMSRLEHYRTTNIGMTRKQVIGERIKYLRERHRLQQKEVSEILGITPSAYACYESGKNEPKAETIVLLSYLYEVSTDFILGKWEGIWEENDIKDCANVFEDAKEENIKREIQEIKLRMQNLEEWINKDKQSTSE